MLTLALNKLPLKRGLWSAALLVLGTSIIAGVLLPAGQANAFTPNYNSSNLIDNPTLIDASTMGAGDIQAFLQSTGSGLANYTDVEACDSTIAPYYSHCGQRISAAQIVYDSAHAYGINPRAILATMEKEQSLVTDPAPSASQIDCAMGYLSCNSNYSGFFTQIDNGTWILRYNYEAALGDATWLAWSPASNYNCSSAKDGFYSNGLYAGNTVTFADPAQYDKNGNLVHAAAPRTITLANAATSSLYCYTPYVGPYSDTGYSGSYNFVYYFQLWFGSTQVSSPFAWQYVGQQTYFDAAMTQGFTGAPTIAPGGTMYVKFQARNVGTQTWLQNVIAGTSRPDNRASPFYDSSNWLDSIRPAHMLESSVVPGQVGTFEFNMKAPSSTGTYKEYFNLLIENVTWFNDPGLYFTINVVSPTSVSNATNTSLASGATLTPGQYLLSPDRQSVLMLQTDGNLVLYSDFLPVWSTSTSGRSVNRLVMQSDGNLVLYATSDTSQPIWNSGTNNHQGANLSLQLQTDGNMVISPFSTSNWATYTVHIPDHLSYVDTTLPTGKLYPGQELQTADRKYTMILQSDGNLVVYDSNNNAIWSSGTWGRQIAYLAMQGDGNLVLYNSSNQPQWNTGTNGWGPSQLVMQSDGNLVLYNAIGIPTWNTHTAGIQ